MLQTVGVHGNFSTKKPIQIKSLIKKNTFAIDKGALYSKTAYCCYTPSSFKKHAEGGTQLNLIVRHA